MMITISNPQQEKIMSNKEMGVNVRQSIRYNPPTEDDDELVRCVNDNSYREEPPQRVPKLLL